jgi:hypothetical protein
MIRSGGNIYRPSTIWTPPRRFCAKCRLRCHLKVTAAAKIGARGVASSRRGINALAKCNIVTLAWLSMGWVRDHRRFGAWPGLAALTLQIVLSFGHVHVGKVHVEGLAASVGAAIANTLGHSQPAVLAQGQQKTPAHGSGQNSGDNDDYCAICASIFLASTSLAAQAPLLPVPLAFERVTLRFDTEPSFEVSRTAFFRSRAPPVA